MKVLHLAPFIEPGFAGGLQRYVTELVRHQRRIGVEASVLTAGTGASPREPAGLGIPVARAPSWGVWHRTPVAPGLPRLARRAAAGVDVVHLHGPNPAFEAAALAAIAARPRLRFVVTIHNAYPSEGASERMSASLAARLLGHVFASADAVIAPHRAFLPALPVVASGRLREKRLFLVPPGCDHGRFRPFGLERARDTVVFAAHLRPEKGLATLVDALALCPELKLEAMVTARANRPRAMGTLAYARERLGERARFVLDPCDEELARAYNRAAVVAVPSSGLESWNLVLLEAAACGAACVRSDLPGLAWAGFAPAVAGRDPSAWAVALRSAVAERDRLGSAALAAAGEYSWERTCRETLAVYAWALGHVRGARPA